MNMISKSEKKFVDDFIDKLNQLIRSTNENLGEVLEDPVPEITLKKKRSKDPLKDLVYSFSAKSIDFFDLTILNEISSVPNGIAFGRHHGYSADIVKDQNNEIVLVTDGGSILFYSAKNLECFLRAHEIYIDYLIQDQNETKKFENEVVKQYKTNAAMAAGGMRYYKYYDSMFFTRS